MNDTSGVLSPYQLSPAAVKRAIDRLSNRRSHEHRPGYLALLRAARAGPQGISIGDIVQFHSDYLAVKDAPENNPYLVPFKSRGHGPRLLNSNVQGSYAPSSIRFGKPFSHVIQPLSDSDVAASSTYFLVDDHASEVLFHMLSGHKLLATSLAVFLFRDRTFTLSSSDISGVAEAMRAFFGIEDSSSAGGGVFAQLFEDDVEHYTNQDLVFCQTEQVTEDTISPIRTRWLSLGDLGLDSLTDSAATETPMDAPEIEATDPVLTAVRVADQMKYAGVILCGPPGTGKTWYAQQIAVAMSGDWDAVRTVQFHPSYQYEDFVFGYAPTASGGFERQPKELAILCAAAANRPDTTHVLVIDEINRSDIVRVFGEALTYIERDKRGQPFQTSSGEELSIPENLFFVGTMNPWDKGIDEIDFALERRFAQIDLRPDASILRRLVAAQGAPEPFIDRLVSFFEELQQQAIETVHLGHAYFLACTNPEAARRTWEFRLRPTLRRACRQNPGVFDQINASWSAVLDTSKD